jgi:hypothetical protein
MCDDVHDDVGGSKSGVFLVSVILVVIVGVMKFAVGLLLLEVFKVVLESVVLVLVVLACWWSF